MTTTVRVRPRSELAADAYMRGQDADLTVFERTGQRLAFLAGWEAAKTDSHQIRRAMREDLAAELAEDARRAGWEEDQMEAGQ